MVNIKEDLTARVHADAPFVPTALPPTEGFDGFAVAWHDRDGMDYELTFCNPATCAEQGQEGIIHVMLTAGITGLPFRIPMDLGSEKIAEFGLQPTSDAEAVAWAQKLVDRAKALAAERGRPVLENSDETPAAGN